MEEETKFEIEEVMRVEQLPKIFYQLEEIGKQIDTNQQEQKIQNAQKIIKFK